MSGPTISACGECLACETGEGWVECPNRDVGLHYVCACESSGCAESGGTMSDRDDDFRRLVPMLPGWTVSEPDGNLVKTLRAFRRADYASFGFPAPDAPLPEAMAFVGRIAEGCGVKSLTLESPWQVRDTDTDWWVSFWTDGQLEGHRGIAPDLAWAAVRAALAAKGGAT